MEENGQSGRGDQLNALINKQKEALQSLCNSLLTGNASGPADPAEREAEGRQKQARGKTQ